MRRIIQYAIVTVWTGAAFLAGVAAKPLLARAVRGDPADHPSHLMRLDQFRHLNIRPADVVVIGDSYVEQGQWSEWLGPGAVNRGIGQNTTSDVLARLDAVPSSQSAILMIGSNDLERGDSPALVARRTALIIARLERPVYLISVLPRMSRDSASTLDLNRLNRAHCEAGHCRYIDAIPRLAPTGELSKDLTLDGVHLNGEGYARLTSAIRSAWRTPPTSG